MRLFEDDQLTDEEEVEEEPLACSTCGGHATTVFEHDGKEQPFCATHLVDEIKRRKEEEKERNPSLSRKTRRLFQQKTRKAASWGLRSFDKLAVEIGTFIGRFGKKRGF